ncbi:MAG: DEAD/DEAH box helicase [Treponema sp.]|jgi:ATP-dependent Lhr-like helicase|nr:DEAD/DEAH box helicase [Treponema sp.]
MGGNAGELPFHPLINGWFTGRYGKPTAIQEAAWPLIEEGCHVLALAPTGSGKTLTSFLSAISRFCRGDYDPARLSVLYISPLKALNEDIRRNLLEPLAEIRGVFEEAGESFPPITVETRSGDTSQQERRRFYRRPPSILVTTPESLGILLLNPRGREVLAALRCLILDEIHSVLGTKRGSFLCCQADRLTLINNGGEFQRIGLSATVNPAEAAAEFLGGLLKTTRKNGETWERRPVRIAAPPVEKQISFTVEEPEDEAPALPPGGIFSAAERILRRVEANRSTLVFTGSRREAESLSRAVNQAAGRPVSFAHHGSLSKELRQAAELGLAEGRIPCVAATSSMELGIDIGSVDEVILAGAPASVSSALQRIGRSGHGVGQTSRGRLMPLRVSDLLPAAALALGIREREIEEIRPIENPLDILAQIILALLVEEERSIDGLYGLIRGFYVFRNLDRAVYDRVVAMLSGYGGYGGKPGRDGGGILRLRELKPRIYWDRASGSLSAAPGTRILLYSSGGVIPSRGLYAMRPAGGQGKIGELDEEFVWERRIGDCFNLGNRSWRITAIGDEAVEVVPAEFDSAFIPFWRAEPQFRSSLLSRYILKILDLFRVRGELSADLLPEFSAPALGRLNRYLASQQRAQGGSPLPGSSSIGGEIIREDGGRGLFRVLIHSFRGGAVNYPLALALAQELEDRCGGRVDSFSDNNTILLLFPSLDGQGPADIEKLVGGVLLSLNGGAGLSRGERQFRRRLESGSRFGAAFREAAERSLMLPRAGFGKRSPLWITRQRSKRLYDAVLPGASAEGDGNLGGFPLIAEAWRSCLQDDFDMEGFRNLIGALETGALGFSFFQTAAGSPFARSIIWQETNALLYEGDERRDLRPRTSLSDRAIAEALGDPALRPVIPGELAADFAARLRRELPGWAPEEGRSLAEWVKERIAVPADEWEVLLGALPSPLLEELKQDPDLGGRLRFLKRPGAALVSVVHREWEESWLEGLGGGALCQWFRFQGPVPLPRIGAVFGLEPAELEDALTREDAGLIRPVTVEGLGTDLVCDAENLDLLLRLKRAGARPEIKERPASLLAVFLALRQGWSFGLRTQAAGLGDWAAGLELPVKLWETEILPARRENYRSEDLETELREGRILWYGAGRNRAGFCRPEDLDLIFAQEGASGEGPGETGGEKAVPPFDRPGFFDVPRSYWEIKDAAGLGDRNLIPVLRKRVWEGRLSSDSWEALRRGITEEDSRIDDNTGETAVPGSPYRRIPPALAARNRWRQGPPLPGHWFSLDREAFPEAEDPWYQEELDRDRVRLLLRRWGILCRPLLERENGGARGSAGPLSWTRLLPAIRRMELAGELTAGRFFSGINSLQFASPAILRELEEAEALAGMGNERKPELQAGGIPLFQMNAADPASPAGLAVEGLDPRLPARSPRNRLYYRGAALIAVSKRNGRELGIFIPPEDSALEGLAALVKEPRRRHVDPEKKLVIEAINGSAAAASPYGPCFIEAGFIPDRGKLYLW